VALEDRAERIRRELFLRVLTPTKPPPSVARAIASAMREVRYGAGDLIYRKGDPASVVYFVAEGLVECVIEGEAAREFDAGSVVGILDLNLQRPRARTAYAKTDVVTLELVAEDWLDILEDNLPFQAESRKIVTGTLHDIMVDLAPDGGFPPVELPDEEEVRPVLEGTMVERLVVLRECHHFSLASVQALVELARRGELVKASRGDLIWSPGAAGRRTLLVLAGIVDVERRMAPEIRASFGRGDLVLGAASFSGALNEYAVTAHTDALLMALAWSDVDDVTEDHFDVVRSTFYGSSVERERSTAAREARRRAAQGPPSAQAARR
jgi:CRP-like cAMP-binding protein